jgi:hypothetical protein
MGTTIRNIRTVLRAIMLPAVLALIISCSGGDAGTTATDTSTSKFSVRMLGTMPAEISEEIDQQFVNAGTNSKAPFLIGSVDLGSLSESQRNAIRKCFDNDIPIVLVRPTPEQRQALRSLLGIDVPDTSTAVPDFRVIQTSRKYEIWDYVFAAPSVRETADTDTIIYANGELGPIVDGPESSNGLFDEPDYQVSRVKNLRAWLEQGTFRELSEVPETGTVTLPKANKAGAAETPANIMEVIGVDYASSNFNYLHNAYAINMNARSVYQKANFFVISANGILSAAKEWETTTTEDERNSYGAYNRGRVAFQYEIRFRVPQALAGEVVEVSNTVPKTVENVVEVSDTFGWELGGKVTGGGECDGNISKKDGPEGGCSGKVGLELSGGVKAEVTKKSTVRDVKVENKTEPGSPGWLFTIPPPEIDKAYVLWQIMGPWTFPKPMATSTFQPAMGWVWKVSDSVRERFPGGLPVIVEFRPVLVHCYSTFGSHYYTVYLKPDMFSTQVSFPWPPTTAAK